MPDRSAPVPYNPVNSVAPEVASPNDYQTVQATPEQMGAGIGQAIEKTGQGAEQVGSEISDYAIKSVQMATEAAANDTIAHQWAPTAAKLSGQYYSLQGKDAVAGYQPYIDSLQDARSQLLNNLPLAQANIVSSYVTRHIAQEVDGATRHQDQQMTAYEDQSSDAFVNTQRDAAVNAGSNPDMINQAIASGSARIQMHGLDRGMSPEMIQEKQDSFTGNVVHSVVSSALLRGDADFANHYYATNADSIPGPQQIEIAKTLHAENMKNFGDTASTALMNGQPIPAPPGGPIVTDVKSAVAKAAQAAGADPNAALTIAGLESSYGQNVGARGDIGQTGKPAATLDDQAKNLVDAQVQAQKAADAAVGGKAEPWQGYICYQQGVAGGPALIKAAADNPNAKAVDVLAPFYSNPATALSAIKGNGGNGTMTAGQFLDFVKDKYTAEYGRASCVTSGPDGQPIALGDAITAPHITGGVTVQPAATPVKALQNFDQVYPDALQRAEAIPNIDQRQATIQGLNEKHAVFQQAASAWKTQFTDKVQSIVTQPDFTSMSDPRLTPDIRTAMAEDPAMLNSAREFAKNNLNEALGNNTTTNSANGFSTIMRTLEPETNPNRISSQDHLANLFGRSNGLGINVKDYNDAKSVIEGSDNWKAFLSKWMTQIANANGNVDGLGQQRAIQWFNQAQAAKKANDGAGEKALGESDFIQKLGDELNPPAPSRMQQITNAAKSFFNGTQKQADVPLISSPEDPAFQQLPSGSSFRTPDGQTRVKR